TGLDRHHDERIHRQNHPGETQGGDHRGPCEIPTQLQPIQMKPLTLTLLRTPRMVAMLSLAALACCGCRSLNQPASASFASVVIAIRSVDEIRRVTGAVFLEAGYSGLTNASGGMVFEKEGTRKHQIA